MLEQRANVAALRPPGVGEWEGHSVAPAGEITLLRCFGNESLYSEWVKPQISAHREKIGVGMRMNGDRNVRVYAEGYLGKSEPRKVSVIYWGVVGGVRGHLGAGTRGKDRDRQSKRLSVMAGTFHRVRTCVAFTAGAELLNASSGSS